MPSHSDESPHGQTSSRDLGQGAERIEAPPTGLLDLFEREGLMRVTAEGDASGEVEVRSCAPVVGLGPADEDFVLPPDPTHSHYQGKPAAAMTLEDYNTFLYLWLERAVAHGLVRCAQCGKLLVAGDDLPDADTWDAILIEKELVAWLAVHFDCKKKIAKKLKGMNPFELSANPPPTLDLADVAVPEPLDAHDMEEMDDLGDLDSPFEPQGDARDEEDPDHDRT